MVSKENYKNLPNVIFTTLLIEKSPQAIPLGAACVASAVKNHKKTKDLCKTTLLVFNKEDKSFIINSQTDDKAASYIAQEILKEKPQIIIGTAARLNELIRLKKLKVDKMQKTIHDYGPLIAFEQVGTEDEIYTYNDNYKMCKNRKILVRLARDIKTLWLIEAMNVVKKIENIKI